MPYPYIRDLHRLIGPITVRELGDLGERYDCRRHQGEAVVDWKDRLFDRIDRQMLIDLYAEATQLIKKIDDIAAAAPVRDEALDEILCTIDNFLKHRGEL